MQQHCSKYFARRHATTLRMITIGQNSTFSEYGDVAYQFKGSHEMQKNGSKYFFVCLFVMLLYVPRQQLWSHVTDNNPS